MGKKILVVDDEAGMTRLLREALSEEGYEVTSLQAPAAALQKVDETPFDLVITDLRMPKITGLDLLEAVKKKRPRLPVVVMTAYGSVDNAVAAMKQGAADYVTKPFKTDELKAVVRRVLEKSSLEQENRRLREALEERFSFSGLVAQSAAMRRVVEMMRRVKDTPSTVLISGESGTGKDLIAKILHFASVRGGRAFVTIDCGALPEPLLESELFGEAPPAGSTEGPKAGLLEAADGGTVYLDGIGDMAAAVQSRLLRFLQDGEIRRIGDTGVIRVDVRVIAATRRDLQRAVAEGSFREDLYFRLAVVPITLPPLRDRRDDIPPLVDHLLKALSKRLGKPVAQCEPRAIEWLMGRDWPGNVRELQNALEFAASTSLSPILRIENFLGVRREGEGPVAPATDRPFREAKQEVVESFERRYLEALLERSGGNISQAARRAGMDRKNLYDLLKKYDLRGTEDEVKTPHP